MTTQSPRKLYPSQIKKRDESRTGMGGQFTAVNWRLDRPNADTLRARDEYRDKIARSSLTPNQVLLGDPMPGRSALERKK